VHHCPLEVPGPPAGWVTLGDSYTIGTSVAEQDRWPNQVVARLPAGRVRLLANLAGNGATSRDVIERQLPRLAALRPTLASLLVGVNDVVRDVAAAEFRANGATILDELVAAVSPGGLIVVSTPDYTVSPSGGEYGEPAARRAAIVEFNAILAELARDRGVAFVDILDLSRLARDDPSLVAGDGLHPSAAQYRLWVDRIGPVVEGLLGYQAGRRRFRASSPSRRSSMPR